MSSKGKNTQLLLAGLVAAAAVGLVLYYATSASSTAKESTKKKTKKLLDDDDPKTSDTTSTKSSSRSVDLTPRKSNLSHADEKKMHLKIEELDKKGKALFKNKQVSHVLRMTSKNRKLPTKFSHIYCRLILSSISVSGSCSSIYRSVGLY
jgi:hypothetical protein